VLLHTGVNFNGPKLSKRAEKEKWNKKAQRAPRYYLQSDAIYPASPVNYYKYYIISTGLLVIHIMYE